MNVEQATRIVTDDVREMAQQSMNQAMMLRQGDPLEVALVIAVQELLNRGVIRERVGEAHDPLLAAAQAVIDAKDAIVKDEDVTGNGDYPDLQHAITALEKAMG